MTELYGSDGSTITNQNTYGRQANGAQDQALNLMRQNRPGLAQMADRFTQQPMMGGALKPQMDNTQFRNGQPVQDNSSLAVPPIYGTVELKAGMGLGTQVPPGVDAYSLFQPTVKRHGTISWQNGRPVWTDLDFKNTAALYGEVEPGTGNLRFNIECPTNSPMGRRRDTITVKSAPSSDGTIQAEMISSYPYGRYQAKAMYTGTISLDAQQQQMQPPQQMQPNSDAIGSVMPGTPVYNGGGMEQTTMTGNAGAYNGGDQSNQLAELQRQNDELRRQNQQLKDDKGHPIRDGLLTVGAMGLGVALQAGRQYMNRSYYGGYNNYNYNYNRLPVMNGGIPFIGRYGRRR